MRYEGKPVEDYSMEELIEIAKEHYLVKKYNRTRLDNIFSASRDNLILEITEILKDHKSFDDIHRPNIESMVERRNQIENENNHPIVGDFILLKSGDCLRVTIDRHTGEFQASPGGSYHLDSGGGFSFSGGCGDLYNSKDFVLSKLERPGSFWFWHTLKGPGGGNGAYTKAFFRVFLEKEK